MMLYAAILGILTFVGIAISRLWTGEWPHERF